jgi:hypothetical protein
MRRVAEPAPAGLWAWLCKPRRLELRVSPLGLGALLGALAVGAFVLVPRGPGAPPPQALSLEVPAAGAADDTVLVRFVLVARGARKVAVAGDWNGWNPEDVTLQNSDGQGLFVATVPMPRGAHEYMFVVDGEWVTDPAASELRDDGFGRANAVLRL